VVVKNLGEIKKTQIEVLENARFVLLGKFDGVSEEDEHKLNKTFIFTKSGVEAEIDIRYVVEEKADVDLRVTLMLQAAEDVSDVRAKLKVRIFNFSDEVNIIVRPFLKIEAFNVDVDHAVSIGGIEDEVLNYFRSRGIGESIAKTMVVGGD